LLPTAVLAAALARRRSNSSDGGDAMVAVVHVVSRAEAGPGSKDMHDSSTAQHVAEGPAAGMRLSPGKMVFRGHAVTAEGGGGRN
jgi:hypothetical protein